MPSKRRMRRIVLAFALAVNVIGTIIARRRGYNVGGNTIVRCRQGHLFTTIWIPGASLKSVRLGWWRIQRCPVGNHWSIVVPVKESSLSRWALRAAHAHRDVRVP